MNEIYFEHLIDEAKYDILTAKGYHKKFIEVILENSIEKNNFIVACDEWVDCGFIEQRSTNCVCGKDIKNVYMIKHINGETLYPIGSDCIKHITNYNFNLIEKLDVAKEDCAINKTITTTNRFCYFCKKETFIDECIKERIYFCSKCLTKNEISTVMKSSPIDNKLLNNKTIKLFNKYKKNLGFNIDIYTVPIKKTIKLIAKKINEAIEKEQQLFYTEICGSFKLKFGKYKGKTYEFILENDKRYVKEFLMKKDWFVDDERNSDFLQYMKYRV